MESGQFEIGDLTQYWSLVENVAKRTVQRERDLGRKYYVSDFALDISQELFLKVPDELISFDPGRGVPLAAYLRQRLGWHAQRIIREERKWRRLTDKLDPETTMEVSQSRGSRVIGPEKKPIHVDMTPSRDAEA